jgi:hypothetical protein
MKRSMIAVCLLFLPPGQAMACIEDHNPGSGWLYEQPSEWASFNASSQLPHRDRVQDVSLFALGLGATILVGVLFRAMCSASRTASASETQSDTVAPLVMPADAPVFDPWCTENELAAEMSEWSAQQAFGGHPNLTSGPSFAIECTMSFSG